MPSTPRTAPLLATPRWRREPRRAGVPVGGSNDPTPIAATAAKALTNTKLVRQPKSPPTTVPTGTPTKSAMVVPAVRTESARPRISGGARLAATEEATGVNTAAPEAAITLIKSNSEKSGTTAAAALALANKSSAPTSRRFLGTPLVAATRIGEATAAVTANTVTKSPAAATETESSRAMSTSTPVTTYAPVPTAKEPKDRVRMRAPILLLHLTTTRGSPAPPLV